MPTVHIHAGELKSRLGGSTRRHHDLVRACLDFCALHGIPATPISTTGIPVRRADGRLDLETNERQEGFPDVVICLPPTGRMGLLEVKTGNAVRSRPQRALQARYAAAGALTMVIRDINDVSRIVAAVGVGRAHIATNINISTNATEGRNHAAGR